MPRFAYWGQPFEEETDLDEKKTRTDSRSTLCSVTGCEFAIPVDEIIDTGSPRLDRTGMSNHSIDRYLSS